MADGSFSPLDGLKARYWPAVEFVGRSLADPDLDRGVKAPKSQDAIKTLVCVLWKMLSPDHRARFLADLDDENRHRPIMKRDARLIEEALIAEMLTNWQQVLASVGPHDRGFAMSIMKTRSKANWWPTDAQIAKMKAIWAERSIDLDDDIEVTE